MNLKNIQFDQSLLRAKREQCGLKQKPVSDLVGVSKQRLNAYESGQDRIPPVILARLCLLYNCEIVVFTTQNLTI